MCYTLARRGSTWYHLAIGEIVSKANGVLLRLSAHAMRSLEGYGLGRAITLGLGRKVHGKPLPGRDYVLRLSVQGRLELRDYAGQIRRRGLSSPF